MPSIPSIGEQYANAASYAREKGVIVDGDQETFGQRLTEVLCAQLYAICVKIMVYNIGKLLDKCEPARSVSYARGTPSCVLEGACDTDVHTRGTRTAIRIYVYMYTYIWRPN